MFVSTKTTKTPFAAFEGRSMDRSLATTETEAKSIDHDFDLKHYEEVARKSREKQGLPPKITDPLVLKRIVDIIDS
jgi:hypothetical protein